MKNEVADDRLSLFVDVWIPMPDAEGEPKKEVFQGDRLLVNAEGHKIWRETLYQPIKEGLKGSFR